MAYLYKERGLGDRRPLLLYGWMYERYEAQHCWYETVSIVQRYVLYALTARKRRKRFVHGDLLAA
jgi:hypothetical protein